MNRQIRRLGAALLVCFTAVFAQLNWLQVFHADAYNRDPRNNRRVVQTFSRPRGTIISADGVVLARSTASNDTYKFQRQYPEGALFGQITGYYNFSFGATGVESTYNEDLAGETPELELAQFKDLFTDDVNVGNVTLTIRKDVQQVAKDMLGDRQGSVVAIDPRTGALLALWGFPSFDPNPLSSHDIGATQQVKAVLEADGAKPLRSRPYQEILFPGSTFKTVTASVGLQTGKVTPQEPKFPVSTSFDIDFTTNELDNFGGEACGGDLFEILRVSCNSAFAAMGAQTIGAPLMVQGAESFGFNQKPPIDLPAPAASVFPTEFPPDQGNGPIARASIGQGDVSATPLQMALVAAAIANRGTIMRPHVMAEVRNSEGVRVKAFEPEPWKTPLSEANAETMRQALLNVVARGTATGLQIPGVEVGGKTGTAQLGNGTSHTWILGFAGPPGDARVAVAVVVEDQPGASEFTGGRVAAPIARAVMEKVLSSPPPPTPGGTSTTTTSTTTTTTTP